MYNNLEAVFDLFQVDGGVTQTDFSNILLNKYGIDTTTDHRFAFTRVTLKGVKEKLSKAEFIRYFSPVSQIILRVVNNNLAVPDWKGLTTTIQGIYDELLQNREGDVARYIPQLACVNPEKFGISVCTVDGQRFHVGDTSDMFSIQSVSKTLNYMLGLEEYGPKVHESVGFEPSGKKFNEFVFLPSGLPHNPYINAGAIMSLAFVHPQQGTAERYVYLTDKYRELAGGEPIEYSNATYLSEKATGFRNYSLSYAMMDAGAFPEWISDKNKLMDNLDLYFQMCSVEVSTRSLSVIAGTIANQGICPITNKIVIQPSHVTSCVALMYTCGMYNYSGEFAFLVGLPAKSGVSGDLLLVVPGVMGIAIWSPRLDKIGNSVRGVEACKLLTQRFSIHGYDRLPQSVSSDKEEGKVQAYNSQSTAGDISTTVMALFDAAGNNDLHTLRRILLSGIDVNIRDEEGNSALMVAQARKKPEAIALLLKLGAKEFVKESRPKAQAAPVTEDPSDGAGPVVTVTSE